MKVFTELHHDSLYESLCKLFEDRLGWEVYRPIGYEWFKEGYWKIAEPYGNNQGTIDQFLGPRSFSPPDGTPPLNNIESEKDGIYKVKNVSYGRIQKSITLPRFKEEKFDIILSTYQPHYRSFAELLKFQPTAKHVCQAGNNWLDVVDWSVAKNMLASCQVHPGQIPTNVNWVSYHQEFSTETFKYVSYDYKLGHTISNFVNVLGQWPQVDKEIDNYENGLPDHDMKLYGASNRDGAIQKQEDIARIMRESMWGWHVKPGGDGYGHVIHNWAASGRPLITHKNHYRGQLAECLLVDGETCIDLDIGDQNYNISRINYMSDPQVHEKLCENMHRKFTQYVDFDGEFSKIKIFLENLL